MTNERLTAQAKGIAEVLREMAKMRWAVVYEWDAELNAGADKIDRLSAALLKYGRHLGDGTMGGQCEGEYGALGLGPCTCGLDEAQRSAHEPETPP